MNDCDNVDPIWSNAIDYSVRNLEDFPQLANLEFGTTRPAKGKA